MYLPVEVVEFKAPDYFDLLIGMDIITQGDFAISHLDGSSLFSSCMPPRAPIWFQDTPLQILQIDNTQFI